MGSKVDFFISYTSADRAWAEWIAWELEEEGYKVVLQAWDFRPGGNFVLEMNRAAREAERTIAVMSPDFLKSLYTQPEWAAAFAEDPTGEKRKLIPVRVEECKLDGLLKAIIYIDLVGKDEASARKELLDGVKDGPVKPGKKPDFPPAARAVPQQPRFPGTLPPVWKMPHNRNPNFTGRTELLESLCSSLTSGGNAALTAFHGLGGVGKTQTAVEYVYRYMDQYEIICWFGAEEPAKLSAEYIDLGERLGLDLPKDADPELACQAVRQELGRRSGWLLVFDNAPGPAAVECYRPQAGGGHVIVTSRNPNWSSIAKPLEVKVFEPAEAVQFVKKRTGASDPEAEALAEELGNLPLALAQAVAYMEETGKSVPQYMELYKAAQGRLRSKGKASEDYPDTVATAWEVSFAQVESECPAAADLLNLCAYLAPDDIPLDMIRAGAKHLPEPLARTAADELAFTDAIAALRRYSLIETAGDTLSLHRLVQAVARDRMEEDDRKQWAAAAVLLVNASFPFDSDEVSMWPLCARLLPHSMVSAGYAEALDVALQETGRLLNETGLYLRERAEFAKAKECYERALRLGEAVNEHDHPTVATILNNLGGVLQDLGDCAGARECIERALRIDEAAYGLDHPNVARDVNNLGGVLQELGDLSGARKCHERALRTIEGTCGEEHIAVAPYLSNLGLALAKLGNTAGALECYERALKVIEVTYGVNHPQMATIVANLGALLWGSGNLTEARECFEKALSASEAIYGSAHPTVAVHLHNLGYLLRELGDLGGARKCADMALRIDEATYGSDHPTVAQEVNNLGSVLQELGDLSGARECYERALRIDETAYGHNHPTVAIRLNNLGGVLEKLGHLTEARECAERALGILSTAYGLEHPYTIVVRDNLAALVASLHKGKNPSL